jgi:hypothetical protein
MLKINFKTCCTLCANRETYVDKMTINKDKKPVEVLTTVGCKHETVCGEYAKNYYYINNSHDKKV